MKIGILASTLKSAMAAAVASSTVLANYCDALSHPFRRPRINFSLHRRSLSPAIFLLPCRLVSPSLPSDRHFAFPLPRENRQSGPLNGSVWGTIAAITLPMGERASSPGPGVVRYPNIAVWKKGEAPDALHP